MHNNQIRIPLEERDYEEYDDEIDNEDKESSEEEKEGTGILGFFKKTFSSVKKTF